MSIEITYKEAWIDFFRWIKEQEEWKEMPRKEKQYLYLAEKHRRDGRLGYERVKHILERYAPDRYTFRETVLLNQG